MASQPRQASSSAQQRHQEQETEETLISSPPGLWLPTTVVKRHRKTATGIWIALLIGFFSYAFYIVYDGIQQRTDPAASMEIKEEVFGLPDVAVCIYQHEGCYTDPDTCFAIGAMKLGLQYGFNEDVDTIIADDASHAIQEAYPNCKVLPTSKLTPNRTALANGDIVSLSATLFAIWLENPYDAVAEEDSIIYGQFASVFFVDADAGPDAFGELTVDAVLPYQRITPTANTWFTTTQNHMILTMAEFTGISPNGQAKETQTTYTQRTTSGESHWFWDAETLEIEYAFLLFTMSITNFEFSSIEEVDPMDAWTIIGAIGGTWQFVVIGFGLFFVFSEKQLPEYKLRNFRKAANKPILAVRRLSSRSSKTSAQDVVVDASSEDLPIEWIKKRRFNGSLYYYNNMTGATSETPPHTNAEMVPAFGGPPYLLQAGDDGTESLPPGWVAREDDRGVTYYMNTIEKTTQWNHPTQLTSSSTGGGAVRMVDAPVAHTRRWSASRAGAGSHAAHSSGVDGQSQHAPPHSAATGGTDNSTSASGTERAAFNPLWPRAQPKTVAGLPRGTGRLRNTECPVGGRGVGGGGVSILAGTEETAYYENPATDPGTGVAVEARGGGGGLDGRSDELAPKGEKMYTKEGRPFYINHITQQTEWLPC